MAGFVSLGGSCDQALGQGFAADEAVRRMVVPDGLQVKLFASEPEIRQPILVKCDDRGRVWVIQYLQYPNPAGLKRVQVDRYSRTVYDRIPEPPPRGPRGADRITILEDTNGDGRADSAKDFVDGLNLTTGLAFGHGGVYVLQVPYLLFYPDYNRDDVPDDDPEVLLEGFGMEDSQSFANHLTWGPDGWLYGVNGSTTTCRIRGLEFQQGVWRYHPIRREFELFCEGGGNLFGLTFDANGNLFYSSNGNYLFFHAMQGAYYPKNYGKHGPLHNLHAYGTLTNVKYSGTFLGPTTGGTIYLGDSFPEDFRGSFMGGNFLGHSASWWRVKPLGSTVEATLGGNLLDARDSWFGATDLCLGPDGSIYVSDFYDQRTAHPDPDANWDRSNGRIYKIEAKNAGPNKPIDLATQSSRELVELLKHPNGWYADQARSQLAQRQDREIWGPLEQQALAEEKQSDALPYVWALYVSGGWNDKVASKLLEHPAEYVRAWTVRLLGDAKQVSPEIARQLVALAQSEPSVVVRAQIAATSKRLPSEVALAIVDSLLERDLDREDPNIPWLLWWALEDKSISAMDGVVALAVRPASWTNRSWQDNLSRLVRRYAAEGTTAAYGACVRLLDATPADHLDSMVAALTQGLNERARVLGGMGDGDLYQGLAAVPNGTASANAGDEKRPVVDPLSSELRQRIERFWNESKSSELRLRLAIVAEIEPATRYAKNLLGNPRTDDATRAAVLSLLAEVGDRDVVPAALDFIKASPSEAVRKSALKALSRSSDSEVAKELLRVYPRLSPDLQAAVRELLFARPATARMFFGLVESGQVAPSDVPIDQLRLIALHEDEKLDAIVRKYWGNIRPGTPEEKLAEIRRLSNDVRAASGDPEQGKELFKKHCSTCHKRQGEGGVVGPDLTAVSRERNFLLTSLVDPSVVIRSQYLAYILTTVDGQVLTGTMAEQDAASVTLIDAKAQRTRIPRDEIAELRESTVSLMPDNLLTPLSPKELRHLFSYLEAEPK